MSMDLQYFTIRLSTNLTSVPPKVQITRHNNHFRLRRSTTRSEPVDLVTYLGHREIHTDGLFGYRTTGGTVLEYHVIQAAGPTHFLVRLTFFPFYPPHGPIQRRTGDYIGDKLWYGNKQLKMYASCGEYGEIGSLPYCVVDDPVQAVPPPPRPHPAPGGAGGRNGGGGLRGGDGNGGGPPAARPPPVELPAQVPLLRLDNQIVNQLINHLCREQTRLADELAYERRRQDERYENLIAQVQIDEIGRQQPWQPQGYAHRVYPPPWRAR